MSTLIPKFDLQNGGVTPTGAVNRPINEKLSETISVKDFGAVGDGVTDDTTAIQNALDSGATKIVFPQGTYYTDTIETHTGQTLDLTGSTLKLTPHTTSHNPVIRIGTVSSAVNHVTIIGGTIDGNKTAQTYPSEEWSPAILIWGSNYNKVIGTIATNCAGDGITVGYDSGRVVGSNENTVQDCEVYNNFRQGIAVTYGNENQILNNRVSGAIDLEINAGVGECKNNLVNGNTGRTQAESLTTPRITDLQISLASLSTSMTAYYGNIITNNHCFLIQSQYNNSTIIANNLIVGSNSTQQYLIDLAASDSCNVKDNILIANTTVATALLGLIRTRACSYLSVTNNEALNDTLAFHLYSSASFGAQTAIIGTHYFYGNMLAGTGKYRSGTVLNPSEYARIRVDQINGTGVSYTQIDGVPLTFGNIGIAGTNLTFSQIGGAGATWIMNIDPGCNNTTSGAGNGNNAVGIYSYTEAGSGKTITAYTATIAAGALNYSAFSFAVAGGTGSFYVNFWY
jgi:parallel beta-helix repeat protein